MGNACWNSTFPHPLNPVTIMGNACWSSTFTSVSQWQLWEMPVEIQPSPLNPVTIMGNVCWNSTFTSVSQWQLWERPVENQQGIISSIYTFLCPLRYFRILHSFLSCSFPMLFPFLPTSDLCSIKAWQRLLVLAPVNAESWSFLWWYVFEICSSYIKVRLFVEFRNISTAAARNWYVTSVPWRNRWTVGTRPVTSVVGINHVHTYKTSVKYFVVKIVHMEISWFDSLMLYHTDSTTFMIHTCRKLAKFV
jgi:hypothetical protein